MHGAQHYVVPPVIPSPSQNTWCVPGLLKPLIKPWFGSEMTLEVCR